MYNKVYKFLRDWAVSNKYVDFLFRITEGNYFVRYSRDFSSLNFVRVMLKLIVTPFCLIKYFLPNKTSFPGREGLAIVMIAKNEGPYIEEWVKFHYKQGVTNLIIYDNESPDNLYGILKPYIDSGFVIYHVIKGRYRQRDAYNIAIHDYRHRFKYMAIIDGDEFMFLRENVLRRGNITLYQFVDEFMTSHPKAGGLAVHWCLFGSNGYLTKPEGNVLENYTMRAEDNFELHRIIKTVFDPMRVFSYGQVHFPIYCRGFHSLNEDGEVVIGSTAASVHFNKIRINHYFTKSREEYIQKRNRGKADIPGLRDMSEFDIYNRNEVNDTEILSRI